MIELHHGDCFWVLPTLAPCSVDALVSDPPAGIGFMGKDWDSDKGGRRRWIGYWAVRFRRAFEVMKPGAHGLVWALPRTSHWTATALEDAGFELRDVLVHIFGQGFPKSHNGEWGGTALKPASEHWILVRRPLAGTVAANFEAHGTGGLNIDGCRIFTDWSDRSEAWKASGHSAKPEAEKIAAPPGQGINCHPAGRWPANVLLEHHEDCELVGTKRVKANGSVSGNEPSAVAKNALGERARVPFHAHGDGATEEVADWRCVDDCPVRMLDEQSGATGAHGRNDAAYEEKRRVFGRGLQPQGAVARDVGGASRFFYCGKATRRERGDENDHPTVKSTELMRYLTRLVTPKGGTVLDITMGSGSTGLACLAEAFSFIGIDLDAKNVAIARSRLLADSPLFAGVG